LIAVVVSYSSTSLSASDVDAVIDYTCDIAGRYETYYLWRPFLPDPKDDMVLEVAVVSSASRIVAHNGTDFKGVEKCGLRAITPRDFLREIEDIP